jgi:hypothetical protein
MRSRHAYRLAIFACPVLFLAYPSISAGQAAQGTPTAGKVTGLVPIVNLIHEARTAPASTSATVYWGDIVNTGRLARARVALNDGSILNIGSDTNMTITQHDAGAQQTELELNYGRVRAKAAKLVKPDAKFEIHTPTGVAGVVGTDWYMGYEQDVTRVIVFEGKVRFCSVVKKKKEESGQGEQEEQQEHRKVEPLPCVIVSAGEASSIRGNGTPSQPVPVAQFDAVEVTKSTQISGAGAAGGAGAATGAVTHGALLAGTLVGGVVGATVLTRTLATTPTCSTPPPTGGIRRAASCTGPTGGAAPRINGQR